MQNVGYDKLVKKHASVDDTLALIVHAANTESKSSFIKNLVEKLGPTTPRDEFLRRVFDYYCRNVTYLLDKNGVEKVYTPARTISEGKGDCKKAATFLASVLIAAGITPVFKHVYYAGDDDFTHIYVIVPNPDYTHYITLDPTNNCRYNKEVNFKKGTLYFINGKHMELRMMGGPQNSENMTDMLCSGSDEMLGRMIDAGGTTAVAKGNFFNKLKTDYLKYSPDAIVLQAALKAGKSLHDSVLHTLAPKNTKLQAAVKNIPLESQRGAFLELIKQNVDGLATNLAKALGTNPKALDSVWQTLGGDLAGLKQEVLNGAKMPITSSQGMTGPQYIGKFSLKNLLHGASIILHAVAPLVNVIVPGAGAAINALANKAEAIAQSVPQIVNGQIIPPPPLPIDTKGVKIPLHGQGGGPVHGSFFSAGGFMFKSLLLLSINPFNLNQTLTSVLAWFAILAPLTFLAIKKSKKWQNLKSI